MSSSSDSLPGPSRPQSSLRTLTVVVVLLLGTTPLHAQLPAFDLKPNSPQVKQGPWVPSFNSMGRDALDIIRVPTTLSTSETFLTLGTSGVVLSTMSALDRPVYRGLHVRSGPASTATGALAAPGQGFDHVGPDRMAYGTAGFLAVSGLVLERRDLTRTSVRVVEALWLTKAVTGFAKGFFNRSRPFVGDGPMAADPGEFEGEHTKLSMPSGHTARAFALASVLAHQADRWYVSTLAYGGAASVGLERVRSGDHWLTDVVVGGALGYLIGRSVVPSDPSVGGINYTPIVSTHRIGLSIQF